MTDPRCLSSAVLPSGDLKRCIRATGHSEQHVWVEAVRASGEFEVARWDADRAVTVWHVPKLRGGTRADPDT